jgi:hypothetical protein
MRNYCRVGNAEAIWDALDSTWISYFVPGHRESCECVLRGLNCQVFIAHLPPCCGIGAFMLWVLSEDALLLAPQAFERAVDNL